MILSTPKRATRGRKRLGLGNQTRGGEGGRPPPPRGGGGPNKRGGGGGGPGPGEEKKIGFAGLLEGRGGGGAPWAGGGGAAIGLPRLTTYQKPPRGKMGSKPGLGLWT